MRRYRIYTEAVVPMSFLAERLQGFTVYMGTGCWEGKLETCMVIEVITEYNLTNVVRRIAEDIKTTFNQESVLVAHEPIDGYLVM